MPVREEYEGQVVWEGTVEVFQLRGCEKAKVCYAWFYYDREGTERYVTVLESRTVNSARKAVQVAIASEHLKRG